MTETTTLTMVGCTKKGCKGVLQAIHIGREVVAYRCDTCDRRISLERKTIGTESKR